MIDFSGFNPPGDTDFGSAVFIGDAYFNSATFTVDGHFCDAVFSGDAYFQSAAFSNAIYFDGANFSGATFSGNADFEHATFTGVAFFDDATFTREANFEHATFTGGAHFKSTFKGDIWFRGQTFTHDVFFSEAKFGPSSKADFGLATFEEMAVFDDAVFEGEADFTAVSGKSMFSMARAQFKGVPDFIQAHFEHAPRFDNVLVEERLLETRADELKGCALRDMPARWRALKRLAIQGHDTERELQFFSGEIRSRRFIEHWLLPGRSGSSSRGASALSFWAGLLYQTFSEFWAVVARPFVFWLFAVVAGAIFYAAQSPSADMVHRRTRQEAKGAWQISSSISGAWHAALSKTVPCYSGEPTPPKDKNGDTPPNIGALSPSQAKGTDVANEALASRLPQCLCRTRRLGSDAAHRTYGCLYGMELYVAARTRCGRAERRLDRSAIQKLISGAADFPVRACAAQHAEGEVALPSFSVDHLARHPAVDDKLGAGDEAYLIR